MAKSQDLITGQLTFSRGTPSWTSTPQGLWLETNSSYQGWWELKPGKKNRNPTSGVFYRDLGIPNFWDASDAVVATFKITNYDKLSHILTSMGSWSIDAQQKKGVMQALMPDGSYDTVARLTFQDTSWL